MPMANRGFGFCRAVSCPLAAWPRAKSQPGGANRARQLWAASDCIPKASTSKAKSRRALKMARWFINARPAKAPPHTLNIGINNSTRPKSKPKNDENPRLNALQVLAASTCRVYDAGKSRLENTGTIV